MTSKMLTRRIQSGWGGDTWVAIAFNKTLRGSEETLWLRKLRAHKETAAFSVSERDDISQ